MQAMGASTKMRIFRAFSEVIDRCYVRFWYNQEVLSGCWPDIMEGH